MDKRILIGIVCTIVAVAVGFSIALFVGKKRVEPQRPVEPTKVTVQLKWVHQAQFAGIYVAKERGLYEEEGLDVTIDHGGPNAPPLPPVLSNRAEFGVAGADDVLVAVSEGKSVRAIAAIYQESPVVYFALKESGIETPH